MSDAIDVSVGGFRTILSLTDSSATIDPQVADGVTAGSLDTAFRKNKLATSAVADTDIETPIADEQPLADSIEEHSHQVSNHRERLGIVESTLSDDYDYLHIKALDNPYAVMADVDLLVPDPDDIVGMAENLVSDDYTLKQSRLLCHPLKVNTHKYIDGQNNPVDIYPDAIWVRKKVCDGSVVLDRGVERDYAGTTIPVPTPEDSFYIVATHAYAHMRLTLAELLHGFEMLSPEFDWQQVVDTAKQYGSMDSTYFFSRAMSDYADAYRADDPVPEWVLTELSNSYPSRRLDDWYEGAADPFTLPLYVPTEIACLASSVHYFRRSLGSMPLGDSVYGTLTHYVILANQVI
jgi:hypothetical protein